MRPTPPPVRPGRDGAPPFSTRLRVAAGLVGLMLGVLGAAGVAAGVTVAAASRTVAPLGAVVLVIGILFGAAALHGRAPARLALLDATLMAQLTLAVGVVGLVAISNGVGVGVGGRAGRWIANGGIAVAVLLVIVAIARRWVPGLGARPPRR